MTRWVTNLVGRLAVVAFVALSVGCGLADDERDERDRYTYINFTDVQFERFCLSQLDIDFNRDSRISRYEARRIWVLNCRNQGIRSLADLKEFPHLRELYCSDNELQDLDLSLCPYLLKLDCRGNELSSLNIDGLRSLWWVDCSDNRLPKLDVHANPSMEELNASKNDLQTLDLRSCEQLRKVDTRENPHLETLYLRAEQVVNYLVDPHTEIVF